MILSFFGNYLYVKTWSNKTYIIKYVCLVNTKQPSLLCVIIFPFEYYVLTTMANIWLQYTIYVLCSIVDEPLNSMYDCINLSVSMVMLTSTYKKSAKITLMVLWKNLCVMQEASARMPVNGKTTHWMELNRLLSWQSNVICTTEH